MEKWTIQIEDMALTKLEFLVPLLEDYIPNMRVDRGDQRVALYNAGRRGVKAWRRTFYYLIECCVLNACVIEGYNDLRHRLCGRKKRDHHAFKVAL